jgi:hypothetical protein
MGVLHPRTELAILEYPCGSAGPLYSAEGASRHSSLYGQSGVPDTWFDGVINQYGTYGSVGADLVNFESYFNTRARIQSPLRMTMTGRINEDSINIDTRIIVEDPLTGYGQLRFLFCVVEDDIYYHWPNGLNWHSHIVRDMVPNQNGEILTMSQGDTLIVSRDLAVNSAWDSRNLTAIAFVQDWSSHQILQAVDFLGDVNDDTAWLSLDPSGFPRLSEHEMYFDENVTLHAMLDNQESEVEKLVYPLAYDATLFDLDTLFIDTTIFTDWSAWSALSYAEDTVIGDQGKVVFYLESSGSRTALPTGVHRIGVLALDGADTGNCTMDTTDYPGVGSRIQYTYGVDTFDPLWFPVDLTLIPRNPDTAWLSLDPSGYPKLTELGLQGEQDLLLNLFLKNASDTAHSIMYPLTYDTSRLAINDMEYDTTSFPLPPVWSFFELDTIVNDSGKLMFYAYASVFSFGMPPAVNRLGTVEFHVTPPGADSAVCIVDSCFYPPAGHLYYTYGTTATDYWPDWFALELTISAGLCGDANGDASVTTGDGYTILNYFGAGPQPVSCWAANVNGDSTLTTGDGFHLLNYLGAGPTLDCAPCSFVE